MTLRSVTELAPRGKKVLVRVDWNVTLGKALQVVDDTRIRRSEKTIWYLLSGGARQVVLCSHLGKTGEGRRIAPVVEYAGKVIGEPITFVDTLTRLHVCTDRLVMLPNLRLDPGEDSNDPEFARELAAGMDAYVNEAFGVCHRAAASVVGVAELLPAYAGFNLAEEVERIGRVMEEPKRPLVVVMGGAKVEDKLGVLERLSQRADVILLGGKLANEYQQKGVRLGGGARVVVPVEGANLLDIGQKSRELFAREIAGAGTVVWNGPMGKVEKQEYRQGTHAVYEALMANEPADVLVGGGDTLAAIHGEKYLERIDWVSTGGGAMLKLIEEGELVGLKVLQS